MNIQEFVDSSGFLTTSNYEEDPYIQWGSLDLIESDIRNMHPESLSPKTAQDSRFANPSLINTHAWAFTYLHLWCIRPQSADGAIPLTQRLVSIFCKPLAAFSDAIINTAMLPPKLVLLVDRVAMTCFTYILRTSLYGPSLSHSWDCSKTQLVVTARSVGRLTFQPLNVVFNVFSPNYDLFYRSWSYNVYNKDNAKETVLDQGRVQFLRKYLGWHTTEDAILKAGKPENFLDIDKFSYFIKKDKVFLTVTWIETTTIPLPTGYISHTYRRYHKNYNE